MKNIYKYEFYIKNNKIKELITEKNVILKNCDFDKILISKIDPEGLSSCNDDVHSSEIFE